MIYSSGPIGVGPYVQFVILIYLRMRDPQEEDRIIFRNVGNYLAVGTAQHPK